MSENSDKYLVVLHDANEPTPAARQELKSRLISTQVITVKESQTMFDSLPAILAKGLSKKNADEYCEILESLGAIAEVLEETSSVSKSINGISSEQKTTTASTSKEAKAESPAETQTGEDLLSALSFEESEPVVREKVIFDMLDVPGEANIKPQDVTSAVENEIKNDSPETSSFMSAPQPTDNEATTEIDSDDNKQSAESDSTPKKTSQTNLQTDQNDEVDELEEYAKKQAKKKRLRKIALISAGALPVLGLLFFLLTRPPEQKVSIEISDKVITEFLKEQGTILNPKNKVQTKIERTIWQGYSVDNGVNTKTQITLLAMRPIALELEITTPPPPKQTIKEIADRTPPPFWLKRAVSDKLLIYEELKYLPRFPEICNAESQVYERYSHMFAYCPNLSEQQLIAALKALPYDTSNNYPLPSYIFWQKYPQALMSKRTLDFKFLGIGKIYLEQPNKSYRIVANLEGSGTYNSIQGTLNGSWTMRQNFPKSEKDSPNVIGRNGKNEFYLYYRGSFAAKPKTDSAPASIQKNTKS